MEWRFEGEFIRFIQCRNVGSWPNPAVRISQNFVRYRGNRRYFVMYFKFGV